MTWPVHIIYNHWNLHSIEYFRASLMLITFYIYVGENVGYYDLIIAHNIQWKLKIKIVTVKIENWKKYPQQTPILALSPTHYRNLGMYERSDFKFDGTTGQEVSTQNYRGMWPLVWFWRCPRICYYIDWDKPGSVNYSLGPKDRIRNVFFPELANLW